MLSRFALVLGCGALLSGCIYYEPVPVQARRPLATAVSRPQEQSPRTTSCT